MRFSYGKSERSAACFQLLAEANSSVCAAYMAALEIVDHTDFGAVFWYHSTKVGKANEIGWYQILPDFWTDALRHDPSIGGEYEDVAKDKEYAEKVILAYWDRYATIKRLGRVPTDEDRARIHNGGPNGYKKEATIAYWSKVRKELDEWVLY